MEKEYIKAEHGIFTKDREGVHQDRARDIYLLKMEKKYIKAEQGIYIY